MTKGGQTFLKILRSFCDISNIKESLLYVLMWQEIKSGKHLELSSFCQMIKKTTDYKITFFEAN